MRVAYHRVVAASFGCGMGRLINNLIKNVSSSLLVVNEDNHGAKYYHVPLRYIAVTAIQPMQPHYIVCVS